MTAWRRWERSRTRSRFLHHPSLKTRSPHQVNHPRSRIRAIQPLPQLTKPLRRRSKRSVRDIFLSWLILNSNDPKWSLNKAALLHLQSQLSHAETDLAFAWRVCSFWDSSADIFLLSCLQLDVADLKQQLARSQTLFPENPSVWIKDLAGYLNLHLTAQDTEPTLSSHPYGQADSYFDMPIYLSCG